MATTISPYLARTWGVILCPPQPVKATVEFTGWAADGRVVDSTVLRGSPVTFSLDSSFVLAGPITGMREGEERVFFVPAELAYALYCKLCSNPKSSNLTLNFARVSLQVRSQGEQRRDDRLPHV